MVESMLIGELARRSGVPAKTLRFYEEAGVLPAPSRARNGYRTYDETALDRLSFIQSAQSAGLTLAEIRQVIGIRDSGNAPCDHVVALLDAKTEATTQAINKLRALKRELEQLRAHASRVQPEACDPTRICEVLVPATR